MYGQKETNPKQINKINIKFGNIKFNFGNKYKTRKRQRLT